VGIANSVTDNIGFNDASNWVWPTCSFHNRKPDQVIYGTRVSESQRVRPRRRKAPRPGRVG
jgi:hypothetical protein